MKKAEDFIKEHNHINYCEAVINREGYIYYVRPSHVETIIKLTGEDREVLYDKMDIWDSPIYWLTEYTGFISVWTKGYIKPKTKDCTKEQEEALNALLKAGLVDKVSFYG